MKFTFSALLRFFHYGNPLDKVLSSKNETGSCVWSLSCISKTRKKVVRKLQC